MVLHRGRGPGGRVAALAPVGHLPVPAPNCADALNPHTPGTRPTARGLAAYNGRASERLRCRAPWRRVHRAPRESSWLLPDGQQGRPTEGRDSFRDQRESRSHLKHLAHLRTARFCAGGNVRGRDGSRVSRGTSRMPGTLIPSASAMLSASIESHSCVGSPASRNGRRNNRLREQNQPTTPRSRRT